MAMRKFVVNLSAVVEIDEKVLTEERVKHLNDYIGGINTVLDAVEYISFNLVQGTPLSSIDGVADFSDDDASVSDLEVDSVFNF